MTARGRGALALGAAVYVAAWAFGSRALYPVAVGLLAAVLLAWLAVRLTARPLRLHRTSKTQPLEQEDVQVKFELELESRFAPAGITLVDRYAKLGERRLALRRSGRFLWGRYVLQSLPRGRYPVESVSAEVEDPFGLACTRIPLGRQPAIIVYPRLVELERVFSEAGVHMREGRRLLLQRPSGFDVHSVRDYVEGDSLRKVHWPSTARRGQLMVKEVEDSPRDELAVVVDAEDVGHAGGSFDAAVRARAARPAFAARRHRPPPRERARRVDRGRLGRGARAAGGRRAGRPPHGRRAPRRARGRRRRARARRRHLTRDAASRRQARPARARAPSRRARVRRPRELRRPTRAGAGAAAAAGGGNPGGGRAGGGRPGGG